MNEIRLLLVDTNANKIVEKHVLVDHVMIKLMIMTRLSFSSSVVMFKEVQNAISNAIINFPNVVIIAKGSVEKIMTMRNVCISTNIHFLVVMNLQEGKCVGKKLAGLVN